MKGEGGTLSWRPFPHVGGKAYDSLYQHNVPMLCGLLELSSLSRISAAFLLAIAQKNRQLAQKDVQIDQSFSVLLLLVKLL